jgi:hypothetical protein
VEFDAFALTAPPNDPSKPTKINLKDEIAHSEWKTDLIIGFGLPHDWWTLS